MSSLCIASGKHLLLIALLAVAVPAAHAQEGDEPMFEAPRTIEEARSRAKLLHEMAHGALQVMHRDFFDEESLHAIPSASLEDVFSEMSRAHGVSMKWMNAGTDVVNVDHQPEDSFERGAAKRLAAGKPFVERVTADRYRFVGRIRLASQCLKCHVKRRNNNEPRFAGLSISMPFRSDAIARELVPSGSREGMQHNRTDQ